MVGGKRESEKKRKRFERRYLPEFVYGGTDGAITTFAVVSGVIGASLNTIAILALGFANIFSDGFSIAVAHYFSIKSKNELMKTQDKHPIRGAIAAFSAFLVMGLIPLFSFLTTFITKNTFIGGNQFEASIVLTGLALIIVGWYRGEVTGKHKIKSILQTLIIGGVAASLAFAVGKIVSLIV